MDSSVGWNAFFVWEHEALSRCYKRTLFTRELSNTITQTTEVGFHQNRILSSTLGSIADIMNSQIAPRQKTLPFNLKRDMHTSLPLFESNLNLKLEQWGVSNYVLLRGVNEFKYIQQTNKTNKQSSLYVLWVCWYANYKPDFIWTWIAELNYGI